MSSVTHDAATAKLAALSDDALIVKSRSGNTAAFGELWRRHSGAGRAAALAVTTSFDPDDLVAESFAKIYRAIRAGAGPRGAFRSYLLTTIRNLAVDWSRTRRETSVEFMDAFEDPREGDERLDKSIDNELVARAFQALPKRWQEILWYTEVERLSSHEVSVLIGVKPNAVAALSYRAREGLRNAWVQAHLQQIPENDDCRWTVEHLGQYSRKTLSKRDTETVESHLRTCETCPGVLAESNQAATRLVLVLLPLALGLGAAAYEATIAARSGQTATLASSVTPMPASVTATEGAAVTVGAGATAGATGFAGVATWVWVTAAVVVGVVVVGAGGIVLATTLQSSDHPAALPAHPASIAPAPPPTPTPTGETIDTPTGPYVPLTAAQIAALPEARYDAVISGLIGYTTTTLPTSATAYSLTANTALYGAGSAGAVSMLPAKNFLGNNTVIVPVQQQGDWTLILTPARQTLPSHSGGNAPAQTAAWVRTDALQKGETLTDHIVVSVGSQTLSIYTGDNVAVASYKVGVGAPTTPTPVGVTGYLEARYLDPSQGEAVHKIQLTSLHSAAADEPFGGNDGGLIGIHYQTLTSGAISHGCVRLNAQAIEAVNALPLGTLVTLVP